jgi:hypothetical protein
MKKFSLIKMENQKIATATKMIAPAEAPSEVIEAHVEAPAKVVKAPAKTKSADIITKVTKNPAKQAAGRKGAQVKKEMKAAAEAKAKAEAEKMKPAVEEAKTEAKEEAEDKSIKTTSNYALYLIGGGVLIIGIVGAYRKFKSSKTSTNLKASMSTAPPRSKIPVEKDDPFVMN